MVAILQCLNNTDCQNAQNPYCDVQTATCKQCTAQNPCEDPFVCDVTSAICRNCLTDLDCSSKSPKTPYCDVAADRCTGCRTDADCSGLSFCGPTKECIVGCDRDDQCTDPNLPFCDLDVNQCVQVGLISHNFFLMYLQ